MYNKAVYSVFMTHQVNIKTPFSFVVDAVNRMGIEEFDICWIPDFENTPNLAGVLAHGGLVKKLKVQYLGALSRMEKREVQKRYDAIFVLSGPEPQRTILENKILMQLKNTIALY